MTKELNPNVNIEVAPGKNILKDVYLSFQYSQGSLEIQDLLLLYVIMHLSHKEISGILDQRDKLEMQMANKAVPKIHKKEEDGTNIPNNQIRDIFHEYLDQLDEFRRGIIPTKGVASEADLDIKEFYTAGRETIVREITLRELKKDIKYMKEGRPKRRQSIMDPFESYVKTYALEQKSTHSRFDSLFQSMHDLILKPDLPVTDYFYLPPQKPPVEPFPEGIANQLLLERLNELSELWEQRHPGEQFI